MTNIRKDIAILGPSGSGKSDLAIDLALEFNYIILSLDSLSIYKEIDIASAKPSKEDLKKVLHFGIDEITPNEEFNVVKFFSFYKQAKEYAKNNNKGLIIVGGTGFYLKMLIDGISQVPKVSKEIKERIDKDLLDLQKTYSFLESKDPQYAKKISANDKYRIEKALTIIYGSDESPSNWFEKHQQNPVIQDLKIFGIDVEREILKERVSKRTQKMFEMGIIDEAAYLERKYSLRCPALLSIGLKECYEFLNGKTTLQQTKDLITTHTLQLAKRQKTFNKGQFDDIIIKELEPLREEIKRYISC